MVTADADVEQVLFGPRGVAEGLVPGTLVIDHSTISPSTARACAARLARQSVQMLDAPVSGGEAGAMAGSLSIMAGGDVDAFERARPLLQAVGRTLVHVGDSGAGQVAKAANQLAICVTLQGMAEAEAGFWMHHELSPSPFVNFFRCASSRLKT
jgi:2-hydroxy-3-oxopropionate reductase